MDSLLSVASVTEVPNYGGPDGRIFIVDDDVRNRKEKCPLIFKAWVGFSGLALCREKSPFDLTQHAAQTINSQR